ncbi:hypothetical protein E2P81_ATG10398 [Venturia nashicola]|nr:hypothetical protein E2P81_ATG10398 [Venturia nashicola]
MMPNTHEDLNATLVRDAATSQRQPPATQGATICAIEIATQELRINSSCNGGASLLQVPPGCAAPSQSLSLPLNYRRRPRGASLSGRVEICPWASTLHWA